MVGVNPLMWLLTAAPEKPGARRVERIAELVAVNGGELQVGAVDRVEAGVGPYGRMGLTQAEGFELAWYAGMLLGMCVVQRDKYAEQMGKIVEAEIERRTMRWHVERAMKMQANRPAGWLPDPNAST